MGTSAATISLGELSASGAGLYRAAADHGEHFAALPCYCGCDTTLAHRSLRDCFITPSGDWDAHASGCEICTAEAVTALELLDAGVPAATVQAQIIDQYGPPPTDDITEPWTPSAGFIPVHPQLETLR
ncbi:MAG TPA: PCYCGC motif-containing (lipo)protein [Ilumatobacter sp.]